MVSKAEMLREYWALDLDSEGVLTSLPLLIEGYCPDLDLLPQMVLRLAQDVNWSSEKGCFRTMSEVSYFTEVPGKGGRETVYLI